MKTIEMNPQQVKIFIQLKSDRVLDVIGIAPELRGQIATIVTEQSTYFVPLDSIEYAEISPIFSETDSNSLYQ